MPSTSDLRTPKNTRLVLDLGLVINNFKLLEYEVLWMFLHKTLQRSLW